MDLDKYKKIYGTPKGVELIAVNHGCDIIVQEDIESVCKVNLYKEPMSFLNDRIYDEIINVLSNSRNRLKYKYGESACIISADRKTRDFKFPIIDGEYEKVSIIDTNLFKALTSNDSGFEVNYGCLCVVHNHPNNSFFSLSDIELLLYYDYISAIVAVGNTHNVYILRKSIRSDGTYCDYESVLYNLNTRYANEMINTKDKKKARSNIAEFVKKNPNLFQLQKIHYKRRKK